MKFKTNINKNLTIKELETQMLNNRKNLFYLKIKKSLNQKFNSHKFKMLKHEYNYLLAIEYKYNLNKLLSN